MPTSLAECREILRAAAGEGIHGACFAVLTERWNQLHLRLHLSRAELYWRPNPQPSCCFWWPSRRCCSLTCRGKLLLVHGNLSASSPTYLIWGGPIWGILPIMAAPVVGYYVIAGLYGLMTALATEQPFVGRGAGGTGDDLGGLLSCWIGGGAISRCNGIRHPDRARMMQSPCQAGILGALCSTLMHGRRPVHRRSRCPSGHRFGAGPSSPICLIFIKSHLRGLHRVHPRRAADHAALRGELGAGLFLPAGLEPRPVPARGDHGHRMFASAYMAEVIRGGLAALCPRASTRRRMRLGLTTGSRCADHPAAGAEDLDPGSIVNTFIGSSRTPRWWS